MSVDWQHPFVDVFRQFGVYDSAVAQSKGQVSVVQDNEIGRKVIRLQGAISANNCVNIPENPSKSLGLTGRYIYLQFFTPKGKYFTVHLDLNIRGRDLPVRFSVSNMYEVHKVVQNHLQIPYPKNAKEKWTILIMDVEYFLSNFGLLPHSIYTSFKGIHVLKSIQICSTMSVRGVFTSDNLYDWDTLPKQMMFKLQKGSSYSDVYQIAFWSTQEQQPQIDKQPLKEVTATLIDQINQAGGVYEDSRIQNTRKSLSQSLNQSQVLQQTQQKPAATDELVKRRDNQIQAKSIDAEDHPLQPYPIMKLERVVGFTVRNCPDIRWGRQAHTQGTIVYAAGNIIVLYNNGKQSFLMGHSQPIACLDVSRDGSFIVSGQSGKNAVIRLWDFNSQDCLSAFATPYKEIVCCSFSYDGKLLVTAGTDDHNREVIIVWGLQQIPNTRKPVLIAKQSANCNVLSIRFSPVDNNRLVSCGHQNIKFWRIKNGHLPGTAVVLNHHARNTTFAVFDFEYSYEDPNTLRFKDKINRVFFGSKTGIIFQVNYQTLELEAVYRVHDQPISSLVVSAGFCVTGSKDQFLRVWPLDFSEFYIEAKHEGIITSLDISLDGLQVACGTSTGGLGVLDISNHAYKTIVRSHTGKILQAQIHPFDGMLVTLSDDCTIRVWDLTKQEQMYEFTFPADDRCNTLACHPKGMYFAAGFKSGITRVFDIENTQILEEQHYHDCEIMHLTFNQQGTHLIVSDAKSIYRIYDAQRNYQPIKTLETFLPSKFNHSAFSVDSQVIATIGDSGTHVNLWDGTSFALLLKIFANNSTFKKLEWATNNIELVCACDEGKVRIYGIERSPGAVHAYFMREQTHMHQHTINNFALSTNLKYLFSVGKESFVKVWDYEFSLKGPGSCQMFIGHSSAVANICVSGNRIITAGGDEGIFVWNFLGFTGKNERMFNLANYNVVNSQTFGQPKLIDEENSSHNNLYDYEQPQEQLDEVVDDQPQQLSMSPDKLVPIQSLARKQYEQSSPLQYQASELLGPKSNFKPHRLAQEFKPYRIDYKKSKHKRHRSKKRIDVTAYPKKELPFVQYEAKRPHYTTMPVTQLNTLMSYNSECHDNIVWCQLEGWFAYPTLNNLIIEKLTKVRTQQVISIAYEISVLALDPPQKHLLVGSANHNEDIAPILVYETSTLTKIKTLSFHTRGVQKIIFNDKHLLTVGNLKECTVAVWDWPSGSLLASSYTLDKINDVVFSEYSFSKERIFEFCTVGRDQIYFWAYTKDKALEYYDVFIERNQDTDQLEEITCVDYISFRMDAVDQPPQNTARSSLSQNISFSQSQKTQVTEDPDLKEQPVRTISTQNAQPVPPPKKVSDIPEVYQIAVIGLKSGEVIIMQYGEFKVLLRRHVAPGEITKILINQSTGKIFIFSTDPQILYMDISNIKTLKGFMDSGFNLNRIKLPGIPTAVAFDPLQQQALLGLMNGNIYFVGVQEQYITNMLTSTKEKPVNQVLTVPDMVVTVQGNQLKFWSGGDCLTEQVYQKDITNVLYDGQYKNLVVFLEGEIKLIQIDRLDIQDNYASKETKERHPLMISSCYGVFDSVPLKLVLSNDGIVYNYESIYKGQEYTLRLNQVLEIDGVSTIIPYSEKKLVFLPSTDSGQVKTLLVDYNADRDIAVGFTLTDQADFKQSPHGQLDEEEQAEKSRMLYKNVPLRTSVVPAKGFDGVYFAILDGLQYLYGRNYIKRQNIIQMGLQGFPLCIGVQENNIIVSVGEILEVIDPVNEERSIIKTNLSNPITSLVCPRKTNQIYTFCQEGLAIYQL